MSTSTTHENRLATLRKRHQTTSAEKTMSACAGAIVTMMFMNPLDVVKTRMQENVSTSALMRSRGTMSGLSMIVREQGLLTLWRGFTPGLSMAIPSTVIYFVGYEAIRDHVETTKLANTWVETYAPLWAGGLARTVAASVVSPLELFRTRLQSSQATQGFQGVWRDIRHMTRQEGILTLWRGFLPTMLRDVPFSAIYWMGYEEIKYMLTSKDTYFPHSSSASNFQTSFIAGASAGSVAAVITTPFDVIKTQRQISGAKIGHILKTILSEEGVHGLFRGMMRGIKGEKSWSVNTHLVYGCRCCSSCYESRAFMCHHDLQLRSGQTSLCTSKTNSANVKKHVF
ncbi:mitochondrial carrier domain-containing protein [Radiomyces spectabilis]|uniref:mitochondrial carrier domain-containing protein n=1 Tax=Radiomyces spectabilis TaxID=64574 RepID=UPI00221F8077|nr:mitochondrial carrier domain-containing protein [Radiomyces spectabilis]KAI8377767.1 mitochondrial carrier domain-containing protein [Radiomyces spectabilis]